MKLLWLLIVFGSVPAMLLLFFFFAPLLGKLGDKLEKQGDRFAEWAERFWEDK
jgi:hypothetical protein